MKFETYTDFHDFCHLVHKGVAGFESQRCLAENFDVVFEVGWFATGSAVNSGGG